MTRTRKKKKLKPLTLDAAEYRDVIAALGLKQTEAAILLGVNARSSRRYALAERPIPGPVVHFLKHLIQTGRRGHRVIKILGLR